MQKIYTKIIAIMFVGALINFSPLPMMPADALTCDVGTAEGGVCVPSSADVGGLSEEEPATVLETFLNWILGIVGLLAIVMIAVAGVMYITSGGSEKQTDTAKRMLMWAIGGLAVVILGYVIVATINAILLDEDTETF